MIRILRSKRATGCVVILRINSDDAERCVDRTIATIIFVCPLFIAGDDSKYHIIEPHFVTKHNYCKYTRFGVCRRS